MTTTKFYIKETDSTNNLIRKMMQDENLPEGFLVYTDFQTAGKGQPGNTWESEAGKNLLFSIVLYPHEIPIHEQFVLSEIASLSIKNILAKYTDGISVKWPNDIYWNDRKIAGILIENSLKKNEINYSIIGIGLNINQTIFRSNAPNPVSLKQITGMEMNREIILSEIHTEILHQYEQLDKVSIHRSYLQSLYRRDNFHAYMDAFTHERFLARIETVEADGKLILMTDKNERKAYYFKEIQFDLKD